MSSPAGVKVSTSSLDQDEAHPVVTEVFQGLHELLDRAGGAVEALDDHRVQLPLGRIRDEPPEVGAIFPRSRSHVGKPSRLAGSSRLGPPSGDLPAST